MANFWENDPIVSAPKSQPFPNGAAVSVPAPPMGAPAPSAAPPAAGDQWWANDPIAEDEAPQPSAQQRYDAALEKVRQLEFAQTDPTKFRQLATERQPTLIPGITNSGPMAPYDATQLSANGLFFGLADEMAASMPALGAGINQLFGGKGPGMGDVFAARQELEAARRDLGREQLGAWGTAAEIAGGLGSGGTVAKGAMSLGSQAPGAFQTLKGLAGAVASGAAYGFGDTDGGLDKRLPGAALGAATGVAAGAAAPTLARGIQKVFSMPANAAAKSATKAAIGSAPAAAAIKATSKAGYKAAERTGAVVDGPALNLLNHDVRQMLTNEGMLLPNGQLVGGYSKVGGALDAMQAFISHGSMTVKQAQVLNRTFRNVAKSADPAEAGIGMAMVKQLDDFFEALPVQAFSTNGKAGMDAVKHWAAARQDWARFKRTDTIEKAIRNAQYDKGGFASGLRSQFAQILKSDRKSRGLSQVELDAMDRFAKGGSIQDFLQHVGSGGSMTAGIAGHIMGGPVAAGAMLMGRAGLGKLARGTIEGGARNAANAVRAEVALPGGLPRMPLKRPPVIDGVARRVAVRAANPGLQDQRRGLADLLRDPRVQGSVR